MNEESSIKEAISLCKYEGAYKLAEHATTELDNLQAIKTAARGLVEYRDRVGPLNFQLEKADDYLHLLRSLLEQS